ncbi:MAG: acylphosphatase [Candidatus Micrarchaeota archaeon]|nr:acylphosphatase [Candidatus Micrarchaeota archaeon]
MKRLIITVYGRVQRVGYRDAVAEVARKLGIKGTVKNLEDEVTVEIIAEGEDNKLKEFVKLVNIKDSPIEVEKLDIKEEKAIGEFKYFKMTRGEPNEELGERLDVAGRHLYEIKNLQLKTNEKLDNTNEKLDKNNEKLDGFNRSTQQQFQHLDGKYHKVSDKLEKISDSLEKLVSILESFKPR